MSATRRTPGGGVPGFATTTVLAGSIRPNRTARYAASEWFEQLERRGVCECCHCPPAPREARWVLPERLRLLTFGEAVAAGLVAADDLALPVSALDMDLVGGGR